MKKAHDIALLGAGLIGTFYAMTVHGRRSRDRIKTVCAVTEAEAEAFATTVIAEAIAKNGIEAAQYQVALKQVDALAVVAAGDGKQTILLPTAALDAFGEAFKLLKGKA